MPFRLAYCSPIFFSFFLCTSLVFSSNLENEHIESCQTCYERPLFYSSCSPLEIDLSVALDDFRSLPEGSWNGNWGAYAAVNFKTHFLKRFSAQLAGSYGLYDWAGRAFSPLKNPDALQQQGFITIGASRQVSSSGINAGIAYDWMLNKNFGLFAVNPYFDQIRAQIGYLIKCQNEIGAWAGYRIRTAHKRSQNLPLKFRGISQVNLFWCHYFKNHGYGMLWAGTPYRRGLLYESGRSGNFIFGGQFSTPVSRSLSIEGHGVYMVPRGNYPGEIQGYKPPRIMRQILASLLPILSESVAFNNPLT